jgi:hypothetical protein
LTFCLSTFCLLTFCLSTFCLLTIVAPMFGRRPGRILKQVLAHKLCICSRLLFLDYLEWKVVVFFALANAIIALNSGRRIFASIFLQKNVCREAAAFVKEMSTRYCGGNAHSNS